MAWRAEVVGTTIKQIASHNDKRISIQVLNVGDYEVYVSQNPTRVLEEGFPIYPLESLELNVNDGDDPRYALYAVAKAGTQELRIYEGVKP
ncbi:MAG: hypothetical protein QXR81_08325 [Candidatus Nezhaarchaeales archaeon]